MLSGFLETSEEVRLDIGIFRGLGESDLVPRLRSCPPASLAMVESLLIQGNVLQVC